MFHIHFSPLPFRSCAYSLSLVPPCFLLFSLSLCSRPSDVHAYHIWRQEKSAFMIISLFCFSNPFFLLSCLFVDLLFFCLFIVQFVRPHWFKKHLKESYSHPGAKIKAKLSNAIYWLKSSFHRIARRWKHKRNTATSDHLCSLLLNWVSHGSRQVAFLYLIAVISITKHCDYRSCSHRYHK